MAVTIEQYEEVESDAFDYGSLGRHREHDDRNREYEATFGAVTLKSVTHERRIPILDQDSYIDPETRQMIALGSCTGNATVGVLGTDPFFTTMPPGIELDEAYAVEAIYSQATALDSFPGQWRPDDTGSSGPAAAKAALRAGLISGYQHTFSFDAFLRALAVTPVMVGVKWWSSMDTPDSNAVITIAPGAYLRGGHEFEVFELDMENKLVGMDNSWGESWGRGGKARIPFSTMEQLLADGGDATVLVPLTSTPPQPQPVPTPTDVDKALWEALKTFGSVVGSWGKAKHFV